MIALPDGTVLARASSGPANYTTNPVQATQNVLNAVRLASEMLGNDAPPITAMIAHVGLAGVMSEADASALSAKLPFAICTASDDRITSALGALGAQDGALLAIGTGAFAAVRRGADFSFFGGWGFKVGDQASGAWLGRALLEISLLAYDGLEAESELTHSVLSHFGGSPAGLVGFAASASPADFATFAPLVVKAAKAGDEIGVKLMARGAAYLNSILKTVNINHDAPICLSGGVGPHYETFLAPEFRNQIQPPQGSALDGALHLARRNLHELKSAS